MANSVTYEAAQVSSFSAETGASTTGRKDSDDFIAYCLPFPPGSVHGSKRQRRGLFCWFTVQETKPFEFVTRLSVPGT